MTIFFKDWSITAFFFIFFVPEYILTPLSSCYEMLKISKAWGVVNHLLGVKNSDELRNAHQAVQPEVVQTFTNLGMSYRMIIANLTFNLKKMTERP